MFTDLYDFLQERKEFYLERLENPMHLEILPEVRQYWKGRLDQIQAILDWIAQ